MSLPCEVLEHDEPCPMRATSRVAWLPCAGCGAVHQCDMCDGHFEMMINSPLMCEGCGEDTPLGMAGVMEAIKL